MFIIVNYDELFHSATPTDQTPKTTKLDQTWRLNLSI